MTSKLLQSIGAFMLLVSAGCGSSSPPSDPVNAPAPVARPSSAAPEDSITRQIREMTLEQKVGQMLMAGIDGTSVDGAAKRMIGEDHVGGVILFKVNLDGLASSVRLLNGLKKANSDNPVPLFLSVDQEGGRVNRLPKDFLPMPANEIVGRTHDAALAERMGGLIAKELKLLGFNVNFAPVLDIRSNPANSVIGDRSFGSKPALVSKMGVAEMAGLRTGGIIPVVKHFPGHGDTAADSHTELPVVHKTAAQLKRMEWVPFHAAVDSSADAVMVAHILFPLMDRTAPASFSKVIIGDILRKQFGFDGVVMTDDITMSAVAEHYGIEDAAVRSVEAGSDLLLVAHGYEVEHRVYEALLENVRNRRLPESRIDESVSRILKLKQRYALSDAPVPVPNSADLPNDEIRRWREAVNG